MNRMMTVARRGAYAAAVLVSLGFGARAAIASPLQTCTEPAGSVGSCASTSDCRKICNRLSNGLIPICNTQTFCCSCQK